MVAFSDELPVGGVLKMNYFGQAQVIYGGEDGTDEPSSLDGGVIRR